MLIEKYLDTMIDKNASDMFLRVNSPVRYRIKGEVVKLDDTPLSQADMEAICKEIMEERIVPTHMRENPAVDEAVKEEMFLQLYRNKTHEGAFYYRDHWRFRVGVFFQRNSLAIVIRKIDLRIKGFEDLDLPGKVLEMLCKEKRGLILLTGITGSGKSTTIAAMIECINNTQHRHIMSIEEPIEFTFQDKKSIINQREIGKDVDSYASALKQFAMHSPDVIYIGQIRDEETMRAALTAAETGALVLSTIHSINSPQTVERILNFYLPHEHPQVLHQLSALLKGVVSMRLLPRKDGSGLVPAYEVMTLSPTIARLIRENKVWELPQYIEQGDVYGMNSFEQIFFHLVKDGLIDQDVAVAFSDKPEELKLRFRHDLAEG